MLTLERKNGESIKIQTPCGEVVIWFRGVRDDKIKLVIDAPREFAISRPGQDRQGKAGQQSQSNHQGHNQKPGHS